MGYDVPFPYNQPRLSLFSPTTKYPNQCYTNLPPQAETAKQEVANAENKLEQYRKDASREAMKKIDAADRKVEEGAAKAKSGISSWFGGK